MNDRPQQRRPATFRLDDPGVVVTEADLTLAWLVPSSVTRNVEPDGLANCRCAPPSALFSCDTTEAMPSEKFTPT